MRWIKYRDTNSGHHGIIVYKNKARKIQAKRELNFVKIAYRAKNLTDKIISDDRNNQTYEHSLKNNLKIGDEIFPPALLFSRFSLFRL